MALQFPEGRYPNREEARALLRACDNNGVHIEEWNEYRKANDDWKPDLSDRDDHANLSGLILFYADDKGRGHGIALNSAKLSGAYLQGTNLNWANLTRANLSTAELWKADLSRARLKGADLSGAILPRANLSGAKLPRANLSGANLQGADLSGAALWKVNLTGAHLERANLSGAKLWNADLGGAKLGGANLSGAKLSGTNLSDANVAGIEYERRELKDNCRGIRVATCYGHALFKRDAEDQDYIDTLGAELAKKRKTLNNESKGPKLDFSHMRRWNGFKSRYALHLFHAWGWIDYGRGLGRTALCALLLSLVFGTIFATFKAFGYPLLVYEGSADSWFTSFYFSIVTYTTLGFGDVRPSNGWGEFVVVVEVVLGYLTLGLLVSILANKVARRS